MDDPVIMIADRDTLMQMSIMSAVAHACFVVLVEAANDVCLLLIAG